MALCLVLYGVMVAYGPRRIAAFVAVVAGLLTIGAAAYVLSTSPRTFRPLGVFSAFAGLLGDLSQVVWLVIMLGAALHWLNGVGRRRPGAAP
jgi:hypothetical protein